jgi:hypothetical protein
MSKQRKSNVVSLRDETSPKEIARRHDAAASFFFGMEEEVGDLVRMIDLALNVYHSEFGINAPEETGNIPSQITDDGHVLPVLLEDIQGRAKELRQRYRDHK